MQHAILAACRRLGLVFCAGWYRRTFRGKETPAAPLSHGVVVHMIKLTERREITPFTFGCTRKEKGTMKASF
jgi:hypothetical protein